MFTRENLDSCSRAVTLTLHQKLKFFIEGRFVIIDGEVDIFVSHTESYQYISTDENCIATPFQVLEVSSMVTLPVEKIKKPIVTSWRDLQIVVEDGTSKVWG